MAISLKDWKSEVVDGGNVIETNNYRDVHVERDEVVSVNTVSMNAVSYSNQVVRFDTPSPGNFEMIISFDDAGNGVITGSEESLFPVTGSAKYSEDTESWGGEPRDAIYLDYQVNDGTYLHNVMDTLVFRDKGVGFQEYIPVIVVE